MVLVDQKILYLLAGHSRSAAENVVAAPIDVRAQERMGASGARPGNGKKAGRHAWFARGEVLGLLQKATKSAVRPADAVRAVLAAKGLHRRPKADQKKAGAAVYQAIIANVKAGRLSRDRVGRVVAR